MAHVAPQLTSYKRPSEIILLDALPATSSGKILKHKLADSLARPKLTPCPLKSPTQSSHRRRPCRKETRRWRSSAPATTSAREIAKKFASEGFTIFAGRRNGVKLEKLAKEIEAAGGEIHARSLDARKEEGIVSFLNDADKHAPLEVCIFNIGANVNFPISTRPSACSGRSGKWRAIPAFSRGGKRRG